MSEMGKFNYECQELAENNAFVNTNELVALVKKQFADRPAFIVSYAVERTLECAVRIDMDMEALV